MAITTFFIEQDTQNSFTNGDTVKGRIIVQVLKQTEIQAITFFAKGKEMFASPVHGSNNPSQETLFNVKQDILKRGPRMIDEGRHAFPFSFKIPNREIPSSPHWVDYKLKAKLKQPMKQEKDIDIDFTFFPKKDMEVPSLMEFQHVHVQKKIRKILGSGKVTMDSYTQRMPCKQGEALQVRAKINNQSNHSVKPTYILYWKQTGILPGQRMISMIPILVEEAKLVAAHSRKTVAKMITIPRRMRHSISTKPAVKNEYILKVHLDMKGTSIPKVKIPIFVLSNGLDSQRQQLLDEVDPGFPGYDNTKSDGGRPKTKSRSLDVPLNFKDIKNETYLLT
ncbi:arrestin domain-containing protein 4-like isoform X2 [Nerophis ophidion]|uniref:arrestin domain-containing protein 4-like isoform X2 n=1 Tax=Nerophis ophidion TaxID=159077 RepID=UPI002AE00663|nr:arrestin domain-containing protein 4-like isoform X2 [Nerophis ophidion]